MPMPSTTKKTATTPPGRADESPNDESAGESTGGGGVRGDHQVRPFRRKRRAWLFKVERITNRGVTEAGLLASVCKRYRTVKTLFIKPPPARKEGPAPASSTAEGGPASDSSFVEITFAGPQPSENCGALLCLLLGGDSVQAWPVELPRGRKRKSAVSTEAADDAISDTTDTGSPRNSASDVPGDPAPPPTPQDWCVEDTQPRQQPRYPDVMQQRQHQHQHYHQQFGTHALFGLSSSFPSAQPSAEGRPLPSEQARSYPGVGSFGFGDGGPSFLTPEGSASSGSVDGGRALLPIGEVRVEPSRTECDLEGRPFPTGRMAGDGSPIACGPAHDRQCHLVFTGLEETGHDLNSLRVTALFGVDAVHQTATVTSPLQVGEDGRAYSSLFYPTLQEIWPELYGMPGVRAVEVDIEVEILSDSGGEYRYHGPQLKVAYQRAVPTTANIAAAAGEAAGGYWGNQPPVSYAADDFHPMYRHPYMGHHR